MRSRLRMYDRCVWGLTLASVAWLTLASISARGAVIPVTSLDQRISNEPGAVCTLQEAISAANSQSQIAISGYEPDGTPIHVTTGCIVGDPGGNTIMLPGAVFQLNAIVDDADNILGPTATPVITSSITIEANGATLQWVGQKSARLFAVLGSTANLTIRNAYIKGFRTKGGDGASGGGGGLGAGGAVYVDEGSLTVDSCTFDSNLAQGGNGSAFSTNAGGGGGGLSGNGGLPINPGHEVGGGGGGGARGNGGRGSETNPLLGYYFENGGGGGGTVTSGVGQAFGFNGGGLGGGTTLCVGSANTGDAGTPGGGGGGGEGPRVPAACLGSGNGNQGGYGGGGGGGAYLTGSGGEGGFGGGGGAGGSQSSLDGFGPSGGKGGFGAGGGASATGFLDVGGPGEGGSSDLGFLGNADANDGGGGDAFGGAIFNDSGSVTITNSTFTDTSVSRGFGGGGSADNGADAGGAIFSRNGILEVVDSTISGNQATGSGGGIAVVGDGSTANFTLSDTIVYNNGSQECFARGPVNIAGVTNLIDGNGGGGPLFIPCPGAVGGNPELGPLQLNAPGLTPTMAIPPGSAAQEHAASGLGVDQRGIPRPSSGTGPMTGLYDIGAFELCLELQFGHFLVTCSSPPSDAITDKLTMAVSPANAGTTNPTVGINYALDGTIKAISTAPKRGYSFLDWTGNVTDPSSASTTVIMHTDQLVTANYVSGTTVLGGGIQVKTGPLTMRLWPITIADVGVVTAHSAQITGFTLTQTNGVKCSPVLLNNLPVFVGDIAPGSSPTVDLQFDFSSCAATARFTVLASFSANGGGLTGSMSRTNQLP